MRWTLIALGLGVVFYAGCIETGSYRINVINNTDTVVCRSGYDCDDAKAPERMTWRGECDTNETVVTVEVIVSGSGQSIYKESAVCHEWDNATVIIEEQGDKLIVADSLVDKPSGP